MTSSLVGSEMCIRDRDVVSAPGAGVSSMAGTAGEGAEAPPSTGKGRRGCLLYTSDAADDM
eukprot:7768680-Prorocentrum_lima.AAC.1